MKVVFVEPGKPAYERDIDSSLKSMQQLVGGGLIQVVYPFEDYVALVCNEEGKFMPGMGLNRALFDEDGEMYDIIAGDFFICGCGEEDFISLTPEQVEKFSAMYAMPEIFQKIGDDIIALKVTENGRYISAKPPKATQGQVSPAEPQCRPQDRER